MSIHNAIIDALTVLQHKSPIKGHETYRVSTKLWRCMLLQRKDTVVVDGRVRKIVANSLGVGVWELSLAPIKENKNDNT